MQHPDSVGPFGVPGNSGSLHGFLPRGVIVMWSGLLSQIPTGWALCDGTLGTPNMVARFVRGINTSTTNPGSTGGSDSATVVQNAHQHEIPFTLQTGSNLRFGNTFGTGTSRSYSNFLNPSSDTQSQACLLTQSVTATNQAHDTRPAYFEVAYIIKL